MSRFSDSLSLQFDKGWIDKPECGIGLDPDLQAVPRPVEVCHTASHRGLRQT